MPKIVDHDAYRLELATKAIDIFTKHGYNGLGMRGIAEALGVSKSALYHYFPSKKELFAASTELITQQHNLYGKAVDETVPTEKNEVIHTLLTTLDKRFQGEMVLLLDYIKGLSQKDIAEDPLLRKADDRFINELSNVVNTNHSEQAYALMMGGLLLRLFNGNQTRIEDISTWITSLPLKDQ